MNAQLFSRLVELSSLSRVEFDAALATTPSSEEHLYLEMLDSLDRLSVPEPSASKKWDSRLQLLEAVEAYHQGSTQKKPRILAWARAVPTAVLVGGALTASVAFAAVAPNSPIVGGSVSEVLSAFGVGSAAREKPPLNNGADPLPPAENQPILIPGIDVDGPEIGPKRNQPPATEVPPPAQEKQNVAGSHDSQQQLPDQVGENPGQGVGPEGTPPGHGGENPGNGGGNGVGVGQGGTPPGQGADDPGQGVEPPGQGGENPSQNVGPPGQSGENPSQGTEPPGQGNDNPGQGGGKKP
jgi:hypothetical protein